LKRMGEKARARALGILQRIPNLSLDPKTLAPQMLKHIAGMQKAYSKEQRVQPRIAPILDDRGDVGGMFPKTPSGPAPGRAEREPERDEVAVNYGGKSERKLRGRCLNPEP